MRSLNGKQLSLPHPVIFSSLDTPPATLWLSQWSAGSVAGRAGKNRLLISHEPPNKSPGSPFSFSHRGAHRTPKATVLHGTLLCTFSATVSSMSTCLPFLSATLPHVTLPLPVWTESYFLSKTVFSVRLLSRQPLESTGHTASSQKNINTHPPPQRKKCVSFICKTATNKDIHLGWRFFLCF